MSHSHSDGSTDASSISTGPELDFVIETDGGRFHRTAFQQTKDRYRDQAHTLAGTALLRFTHGQIRYDRSYVEGAIAKKARDLRATVAD